MQRSPFGVFFPQVFYCFTSGSTLRLPRGLTSGLPRRHHHKYPMDFDRLVFPPAPAILVAGLWYMLLWSLCSSEVRGFGRTASPVETLSAF